MKRLIFIFLVVLLFLPACKLREFALPVWDVDLSIPLVNEKYYVSDLIDSIHIITDDNELLHLVTNGHFETNELFSVSFYPDLDQTAPVLSGITFTTKVPLSDSEEDVSLSYGEIKSGSIRYQFRNINPAVSLIRLSLPDIKSADGNILQIEYADNALHSLSLQGASIGVFNSQIMLDSLNVALYSESSLPEGTPLGELQIQMHDELHFSLFQGSLRNFQIQANTGSSGIDLEYPFGVEHAINLQEASLQIDVVNQLHFSCKFTGALRAEREGTVEYLDIVDDNGNPYIIPAATESAFGQKTIILHDNISRLLQIMPTHIDIISPQFTIDTESGFGSLQDNQIISAEYLVDAPFRFTLFDHPFEIQEVLEISIPTDNRDKIRKNLMDAQLEILLENKLPMGGRAYAYFSTEKEMDISDPATYNFMKTIAIKSNNEMPGWQQLPGLNLSRDEVLIFAEEEVYLKWVFSFDNTNEAVEIYASTSDYIAIKGSFKGKIRVEE